MSSEDQLQPPAAGASVVTASNLHKKIRRIEGIGGHTPSFYCCVCGKSTKKNSDVTTCVSGCPNLCHPDCASSNGPFHCSQVKELREQQGVSQDVVYIESNDTASEAQTTPDSLPVANTDQEKLDAANLIKTQQATISKLIQHLAVFAEGKLTLTELPIAVAAAREVIANCTVPTASIAVTARAESIDAEYSNLAQLTPTLSIWWTKTPLAIKGRTRSPPVPPHPVQPIPPHPALPIQPSLPHPAPPVQPSPPHPAPPVQPTPPHPAPPVQPSPPHQAPPVQPNPQPPSNRAHKQGQGKQGQGRRDKQAKTKKPGLPICSHCRRRGHTEAECRSKLQCDFCNLKGHARSACLWKSSVDRTNTLEQEVRKLISEVRYSSPHQVPPQHQPQRYYLSQQWPTSTSTSTWAPAPWPHPTQNIYQASTQTPTAY